MSEQLHPFAKELKRQGKSESTITHYLSDLALYARWVEQTYGEPFRIEEMTLSDVRAYLAYLRTVRKLKPASINRKLAALKALGRWAVATGTLVQDPTRDVKGVRQQRHGPRALSAQEFRRMVRKAEQTGRLRDVAILETLGRTGLRVSELTALELDDVELKERSGLLTVRLGKGARFRQVPLPCEVRRAMREYLEIRPASDSQAFFLSQRGGALTPSAVWRVVGKYANLAGVECSPHTLRHTYATLYLRKNPGDLVGLARLLGHESIETVAIYTQPTLKDLAQRVEGLGAEIEDQQ